MVQLAEQPSYFNSAIGEPRFDVSIRPLLLGEIHDRQTQQAVITRDVLFALLGYEGCYVRFSERFDPHLIHDRIHGPDYKVAKHLDVSLKAITKKLLRYGKYYSGLKGFSQVYDEPRFGKVNQRLCSEISSFLSQYQQLVMGLEEAFQYNGTFSLSVLDSELSKVCADKLVHLYEIAVMIHSETEERTPQFVTATEIGGIHSSSAADPQFNTFLQSIRNDVQHSGPTGISSDPMRFDVCKGGLVLQVVQRRFHQFKGDKISSDFLAQVFDAISKDYLDMLNLWLSSGEVDDPFEEFLIRKNDLPRNIFFSNMEKYWDELYVIKIDGLIDQFKHKDIQTKILSTGKFLNVFKQCTGATDMKLLPTIFSATELPAVIRSLYSQDFEIRVNQFYERANKLLLNVLFRGYRFPELLQGLNQTYLLRDSYQIDNFLEKVFYELGKSKRATSTVKLVNVYNDMFLSNETSSKVLAEDYESSTTDTTTKQVLQYCESFSIDSSSFYEIAEEIINIESFDAEEALGGNERASSAIKRLVTQSLQRRPIGLAHSDQLEETDSIDECVISGVNVDINLPFPLNLMISENLVFEYQLIFKFQMILKFASKLNDQSWKDIVLSTVWNYKHFSPQIKKLILRCRLLNARIKNFLNEIQNYFSFSVIEPNIQSLRNIVDKFQAGIDKKTNQRTSASPDQQFFMEQNGRKNGDIFDEKIMATNQRLSSSSKLAHNERNDDIYELKDQIGSHLNNILRDTMVTNGSLLEGMRVLLNSVIQFATTVTRLKKTLISMDETLLSAFKRDFPDRFGSIECNEDLIKSRLELLNDVLTRRWTNFNDSLQNFRNVLEGFGSENPQFIVLVERLSVI